MSTPNSIYVDFATFVVAPLRHLITSGEVPAHEIQATIEKIADLLGIVTSQASALVDASDPNKELTRPLAQPHGKAVNGADFSPLEAWLKEARRFAPRQRSLARQIEILQMLDEVKGPIVLSRLHDRLIASGLSDNQAAVVTQISRMKKLGLVLGEAHGLYARTDAGANELIKLRRNYAALFVPDDVRKMIAAR